MAYYLQWSADTGSDSTNNELLEISGITGVLASIQYTVESSAISHSVNRSLYDIRRLVGSVSAGAGASYIFEASAGNVEAVGLTNRTKNGSAINSNDFLYNYVAGDVFKFDVNLTPSGGAIAIGARYNELESAYGLAISEIIITDDNGAHTIDMSDSGGTGTSLTSTDAAITATLYNFPVDDSMWVQYGAVTPVVRKSSAFDIETTLGTITTATLNSVNVFDHVTGQAGTTVSFEGAATDEITTSGEYTLTLGDGTGTEDITVQVNVVGLASFNINKDGADQGSLTDVEFIILTGTAGSRAISDQIINVTTTAGGDTGAIEITDTSLNDGDTVMVAQRSDTVSGGGGAFHPATLGLI